MIPQLEEMIPLPGTDEGKALSGRAAPQFEPVSFATAHRPDGRPLKPTAETIPHDAELASGRQPQHTSRQSTARGKASPARTAATGGNHRPAA